jgi:hypothetical protein
MSQALLVESRHRIATSGTLIATALFRTTRRRRLEGGSDGDGGREDPAVCVLCNTPIVKPTQSSVTINERPHHSDCWERREKRSARARA